MVLSAITTACSILMSNANIFWQLEYDFASIYLDEMIPNSKLFISRLECDHPTRVTKIYFDQPGIAFSNDLIAAFEQNDKTVLISASEPTFIGNMQVQLGDLLARGARPVYMGMNFPDECPCATFKAPKMVDYHWPLRTWKHLNRIFLANGSTFCKPCITGGALRALSDAFREHGKVGMYRAFFDGLADSKILVTSNHIRKLEDVVYIPERKMPALLWGVRLEEAMFKASLSMPFLIFFTTHMRNEIAVIFGMFCKAPRPTTRLLNLEPVFRILNSQIVYHFYIALLDAEGRGARRLCKVIEDAFFIIKAFPRQPEDLIVALPFAFVETEGHIMLVRPDGSWVTSKGTGLFVNMSAIYQLACL